MLIGLLDIFIRFPFCYSQDDKLFLVLQQNLYKITIFTTALIVMADIFNNKKDVFSDILFTILKPPCLHSLNVSYLYPEDITRFE